MKTLCKALLPLVALIAPLAVASPAGASVGNGITFVQYSTHNKIFAYANAGTAHNWFRVHARCGGSNHLVNGGWQNQPGPFLGSTATCNAGEQVNSYGIDYQ